MQTVVRSYLTAGVALAGAGVIAVGPIAPTPPDIHLPAVNASSAAVALSALTNPLDAWAQTLSTASANLQALGEQLLSNNAPILQTVISNQIGNATVVGTAVQTYAGILNSTVQGLPAALQSASDLISQGQITDALDGLTTTLLPAILGALDLMTNTWSPISTTAQNFANVIKDVPALVTSLALPAVFPLLSVLNGVAATAQDVVTAANAGDTEGAVNALINAPASLTDAFLNGKGTILGFIPVSGLLSPESPLGALGSGPIASLIDLPNQIASVLKPNTLAPTVAATAATLSSSAVSTLSSAASARTVTLSLPAAETATDATGTESETASASAADSAKDTVVASTADAATSATDTEASASAAKAGTGAKSTVKQVRENIKKAAERITGKSDKGTGGTSAASAGSSSDSAGGSNSSSSGHSGTAKSTHKSRGNHHD